MDILLFITLILYLHAKPSLIIASHAGMWSACLKTDRVPGNNVATIAVCNIYT